MNRWITILCTVMLLGASAHAQALDYALPDLAGRQQSLDQYRGKWVIVNYWATWCGTCRKELPDLKALHENNRGNDIVVVGINFETIDAQSLKDFVAAQSIPYPVLRSEPMRETPLGPVPALPTTYILDPSGKPVAGEIGIVTRQDIEAYIAAQRER